MSLTSEIAALATLGKIVGESKTYKNVIDEFIEFTIIYHCYDICENAQIAKDLITDFNFDIPLPIIKNSIHNLTNKGFLTYKIRIGYIPCFPEEEKEKIKIFIEKYKSEVNSSDIIFSELVSFVKAKSGNVSSQLIQKVFRAYLLGDLNELSEDEKEINKIIGIFILQKTSESADFSKSLEDIKSNTIIRQGLIYTPEVLENPFKNLTLFLDMEILFDGYGFNGEVYRQLFNDFITLVNELNQKGSKISLCYFDCTKQHIENYFNKAKEIICNRGTMISETTAMDNILKDCQDLSDVVLKQSAFFDFINKQNIKMIDMGIYEERLRTIKVNEMKAPSGEDFDREFIYRGNKTLRPLCYIKLLRAGAPSENFTTLSHLFITRTRYFILNAEKDKKKNISIAFHLDSIINDFWFANGNGLKEAYPIPTNTVSFVQRILSSEKRKEIIQAYQMIKNSDKDQVELHREVAALKCLTSLPEQMTSHSFDSSVEEEMRELLDSKENLFLEEKKTNNMVGKLEQEINEKTSELMQLKSKKNEADNEINEIYPSYCNKIRLIIFGMTTIIVAVFIYFIAKNWSSWGECLIWIITILSSFFTNFLIYLFRVRIPGIKKIFIKLEYKVKKHLIKKVYTQKSINIHRIETLEKDIKKLVEIKSVGVNKY